MNRLSILLLYALLVSSANASLLGSNNDAIGSNGLSYIALDVSSDAGSETVLSQFSNAPEINSRADSIPPASWVIGLGLCLVFLGYKMKNKAH